MGQLTYRINPGDPEAAGLVLCMAAVPGGMMDLVTGTIGTRSGTADPSASNELGTLDAYFDGNGDQYNFGSTPTVNIANDWTIVWEAQLDAIGNVPVTSDAYPGIAIFARGASDPLRIGYSSDTSYDDIYVGTRGGTQSAFLLPSGHTKTGQRHWGVVSSIGGTRAAWVNGLACTAATAASLAVITDDTRVGGTSGTTSDWFGGIRQVRFYARGWSADEARRFFDPATRDSLFRPPRRKLYSFAVAAGGDVSADAAITEAADTASGAATVDVAATGAVTEAADTASGAATVDVAAAGAVTESADTSSATVTVAVAATGAVTEAADTASGAATVDVAATGAVTEAADTVSSEATVGAVPVEATGAVTEAADTASGTATVDVAATGAVTESADTSSATATVAVAAAGAITEAADTVSGAGTVASTTPVSAEGAVTEAADTVAGAATTGAFVAGNERVFLVKPRQTLWYVRGREVVFRARTRTTTWNLRRAA